MHTSEDEGEVAPIQPRLPEFLYSTNPKTARARAKRQALSGFEVELVRKRTADRKAKSVALARLRGSAAYREAAEDERKKMEAERAEALEATRFEKKLSGAFALGNALE